MRIRVAIWASVGFLVAAGWAGYAFAAPPEFFLTSLREPLVHGALYLSCPVAYAGRYYPIQLWRVLLINAATYALVGFIIEALRSKPKPGLEA